MEIASAVCLASADSAVSRLSAHNLRVIALAERMVNVKVHEAWSEEDRVKRFAAYEQIGDPKIIVTGTQCPLSSAVRVPMNQCLLFLGFRSCGVAEKAQKACPDDDIADAVHRCHLGGVLLSLVCSDGARHSSTVGSSHC